MRHVYYGVYHQSIAANQTDGFQPRDTNYRLSSRQLSREVVTRVFIPKRQQSQRKSILAEISHVLGG